MDADPNIVDICLLAHDDELTDDFLLAAGIGAIPNCKLCNGPTRPRSDKPDLFKCNACKVSQSKWHNTMFSQCKIGRGMVILLGYLWIHEVPFMKIVEMTHLAKQTVRDWIDLFMQALIFDLKNADDNQMIGGPEVIVEIDESKFGKRKYHTGHKVEGVWVVGGVERTEERKMFAVTVEKRDANTLLDVIGRYVLPGSIVYTDCWKGYKTDGLLDLEMIHATVNHSLHFKDPETGVHTNSIEGTWHGMKNKINKRNRTMTLITPTC